MARPLLSLAPQHCDKCMACMRVCPQRAINVSAAFVFIDWDRCDGCGRCVEACEPGAIRARGGAGRGAEGARADGARPAPAAAAVAGAVPTAAAATAALAAPIVAAARPLPRRSTAAARPGLAAVPDEGARAIAWKTWQVAVLLGGVLALYGLQQGLFASDWWRATVPMGAKPLLRAAVLVVVYAGQLGLLALLGLHHGGEFSESLGLHKTEVRSAALAVVGLAVLTRLFTAGYLMALAGLGLTMPDATRPNLPQYFGRDALGMVLTVLLVVIVGPFFEEVVFRGVVLEWSRERTGEVPAIAASAVVFAAFHFSAWTFVPLAVMGAAAGWVALRYRSVWPAYALHLAYNGIAVLLTFAVAWK